MKNKKTMIAIISIVALVLVLIGVTYAYWLVTRTQTNPNVISSACLDITLDNEANDITLTNQFPMSDEEGMALTPYTFTVTNNCNTSIDYQVALEAIGTESDSIASSALKVALDDSAKLYSNYGEVATTISGAYESRAIGYARLAATGTEGSSATHELRIWIDEDAPISEMNKTFQSKISVTIGQGIEMPVIQEGMLAYDILANYGGTNAVSEIDETEVTERITSTGDQYVSTTSNYYYGTEYTYDSSTGRYTLSGTVVQATLAECRSGSKTCGKYTLKSTSSTYSSTTLYEVTDFQTSGNYITANTIRYTNAFGFPTTSSEAGLFKTQDDLGDSYYFRGATTDNYVQFGTYAAGSSINVYDEESWANVEITFEEETPMYWRIVRINGDGTIRLVYDGTTKNANGVAHTANVGMTKYNDSGEAKYVGYTYDTSETDTTQVDSTIKTTIDTWYNNHIKINYGTYIADSIFCNDREVTSYYDYDNDLTTTEKPSGDYETYFAPYDRLTTNKTPRLTCINKSDRYTINETIGNGYLSNPVGLLTADEAFFAGGSTASNNSYYLYSGEHLWTSAPYHFSVDDGEAYVWLVYYDGSVYADVANDYVFIEYGARPVINLRADVEFTGNGSYETPYVITTN